MNDKKCWVAKVSDNLGNLFDYELSPRFESIYDCQKFIDEHCTILEWLLKKAFDVILVGGHYDNGQRKYSISFGGSFIRCYNIKQQRFADGFDF